MASIPAHDAPPPGATVHPRPAPVMPPACLPDAAPAMTAGTVMLLSQYHARLVALVKMHRDNMEGWPLLADVYRDWIAEDEDTARRIAWELRGARRGDVADRLVADMARDCA